MKTVLRQLGLKEPWQIKPISGNGLINETFSVSTSDGEFVIQKLHSIVTPEIAEDARAITAFLKQTGTITVPEILASTVPGWRIMKKLTGATLNRLSPTQAASAGALAGKLHRLLKTLKYQCRGGIPHFHDTQYIFEEFKKSAQVHLKKLDQVAAEYNFLINEVHKYYLPQDLPRQIIHGDLKAANFLFDGDRAVAVLDFDTCMNHSPLIDIGDALRSWTNYRGEDVAVADFRPDLYEAAMAGFLLENSLTEKEKTLIPQAFKLLILEQATRFLKDYFDDCYYGWDPSKFVSRAEHNLARCRGQIDLFKQVAYNL